MGDFEPGKGYTCIGGKKVGATEVYEFLKRSRHQGQSEAAGFRSSFVSWKSFAVFVLTLLY